MARVKKTAELESGASTLCGSIVTRSQASGMVRSFLYLLMVAFVRAPDIAPLTATSGKRVLIVTPGDRRY